MFHFEVLDSYLQIHLMGVKLNVLLLKLYELHHDLLLVTVGLLLLIEAFVAILLNHAHVASHEFLILDLILLGDDLERLFHLRDELV